MKKTLPPKYNNLIKLTKDKKFKDVFETNLFRTRLSSKIYQSRIEQEMSQSDLKTEAKTTQRIISDIENGNYNMGIDLLYKIFKSLKKQIVVDGEDLITGDKVGYEIKIEANSSGINNNQSGIQSNSYFVFNYIER